MFNLKRTNDTLLFELMEIILFPSFSFCAISTPAMCIRTFWAYKDFSRRFAIQGHRHFSKVNPSNVDTELRHNVWVKNSSLLLSRETPDFAAQQQAKVTALLSAHFTTATSVSISTLQSQVPLSCLSSVRSSSGVSKYHKAIRKRNRSSLIKVK